MAASTAHVEHKPNLKWPWQVRIINRAGKSVMLTAHKTETEALRKVEQIKESAER